MIGAGPAGEEGRREGPDAQAVGQDQPRARARRSSPTYFDKAGLTPVSRRSWASTSSATAARPASATAVRCRRRSPPPSRSDNLVVAGGALRQPQLRRPHPPARARELPRVAAAGGGLRARRADDIDLTSDPIGQDQNGQNVYLRDIWPTRARNPGVDARRGARPSMFREKYADVFNGDRRAGRRSPCRKASASRGKAIRPTCACRRTFDGMTMTPAPLADVTGRARAGGAGRLA